VKAKFFDWNGTLLREMQIPKATREYKLAGIKHRTSPGYVSEGDPERTFTLILIDESREALYRENAVAGNRPHDLDRIAFELRHNQDKQDTKEATTKQKELDRILVLNQPTLPCTVRKTGLLTQPTLLHAVRKPVGVVRQNDERQKLTYWP
jgi:hypothetical protein